ncbi:MAG: hypothetical protein PWR12_923 [Eubacteriaceae bacterium]|nr:hypothetical protein [Eubacteriaceae bacterium]MDK2937642.1 hypothetical protein [Eubacteriaceae bacterium]
MIIIIPLSILMGFLTYKLRPRSTDMRYARFTGLGAFIISAVIAVASVVIQIIHNTAGEISVSGISNNLFIGGFFFWLIGLAIAFILAFSQKKELARNIGFGMCLTFFILVIELALLEGLGGV